MCGWSGARRRAFAGGSGILGVPRARELVASAIFFDIATARQLVNDPWEKTPADMLQSHTMRDFANAGGL